MTHQLPALPFAETALEPHISAETLQYHHGKHHAKYVSTLNDLVSGTELEDQSLEKIVQESTGKTFNNAAQAWNHAFYWNCLSPKGGGKPDGGLAAAIDKQFGSFDQFQQQFNDAATSLFGSSTLPNLRDPVGQTSTQAGISPRRVRCRQNVHFSTTPLTRGRLDR